MCSYYWAEYASKGLCCFSKYLAHVWRKLCQTSLRRFLPKAISKTFQISCLSPLEKHITLTIVLRKKWEKELASRVGFFKVVVTHIFTKVQKCVLNHFWIQHQEILFQKFWKYIFFSNLVQYSSRNNGEKKG